MKTGLLWIFPQNDFQVSSHLFLSLDFVSFISRTSFYIRFKCVCVCVQGSYSKGVHSSHHSLTINLRLESV